MAVQIQRVPNGQSIFPVTQRPSVAVLAKATALVLSGWLPFITRDESGAYRFPSQRTPGVRYAVLFSVDGHRVTCDCRANTVCTHITGVEILLGLCALWAAAEVIQLPVEQPQAVAS